MKNSSFSFFAFSLLICLLVSSCADPAVKQAAGYANLKLANSGAPYRWQSTADGRGLERHLVDAPVVATIADEQLHRDILVNIGRAEVQRGGETIPQLIETRAFGKSAKGTTEIWLVSRKGQSIAYVVTMKPSPEGGTDLHIEGGLPVVR